MNRENTRNEAGCFTGHREMGEVDRAELRGKIARVVRQWYDEGVTRWYCGMALGFDMLAAEVVLSLQDELPDLELIAAVPFAGQEDRWRHDSQVRYNNILDQADEVVYVTQRYERGCEARRNRYMINHSSRVIAFYDGVNTGGTGKTVAMAREQSMPVVNIYLQ